MFHIFNSIFLVQFYAPSTSVITVLHYYNIVVNFCQMNSILEDILGGFAFQKVFFFVFCQSIFFGVLSKYVFG